MGFCTKNASFFRQFIWWHYSCAGLSHLIAMYLSRLHGMTAGAGPQSGKAACTESLDMMFMPDVLAMSEQIERLTAGAGPQLGKAVCTESLDMMFMPDVVAMSEQIVRVACRCWSPIRQGCTHRCPWVST